MLLNIYLIQSPTYVSISITFFIPFSYISIFSQWFLSLFPCFWIFFTVHTYIFLISLISFPCWGCRILLKIGPFWTLLNSKIKEFIRMKISWNLCVSTYTWYTYVDNISLILLISLISFPFCPCSRKDFEKTTFLWIF